MTRGSSGWSITSTGSNFPVTNASGRGQEHGLHRLAGRADGGSAADSGIRGDPDVAAVPVVGRARPPRDDDPATVDQAPTAPGGPRGGRRRIGSARPDGNEGAPRHAAARRRHHDRPAADARRTAALDAAGTALQPIAAAPPPPPKPMTKAGGLERVQASQRCGSIAGRQGGRRPRLDRGPPQDQGSGVGPLARTRRRRGSTLPNGIQTSDSPGSEPPLGSLVRGNRPAVA